jgi:hypothetical protein
MPALPPPLTNVQIIEMNVKHGFPKVLAAAMAAVAMRESGGNPRAFNDNAATGDLSYGLYQINMLGELGQARLKLFRAKLGLKKVKELFDPEMNTRAAVLIWDGKYENLRIAWGIESAGVKTAEFEKRLPAAIRAALQSPVGASD